MTTVYLQIPILPNNPVFTPEAFAIDYEAITGEEWIMNNMEEEAGVLMMGGSSVCTEAMAADLKTRWPMMSYHVQVDKELPPNWTPKEEEE